MPITFHDTDDIDELGIAAFLHVVPAVGSEQRLGALLFTNARGEPLEFAYNRLELMQNVLWRTVDREQAAVRRLALSLFDAVTLTPSLLICRADVVGPHLFGPGGGIQLDIPVCRVALAQQVIGYAGSETQDAVETVDQHGEVHQVVLFWTPAPPDGPAATLFSRLVERSLLLEPFSRAERGLAEVYGNPAVAP